MGIAYRFGTYLPGRRNRSGAEVNVGIYAFDVAWLRRRLLGDTAMDAWLASPPEVAAGTAAVAQK